MPPWRRLHQALMPDYNVKATLYWWTVVAAGGVTLLHALGVLAGASSATALQVLGGVTIAMVAAIFPLRIPGAKNSFAAGDIFIFGLLLLHGPAAAALAGAGEALVASWRTSKRWTSRIASPAMAAVSLYSAGMLLDMALVALRARGWSGPATLLVSTTVFALVYFVLNTLLVTLVPKLKRNERLTLAELFGDFGWVGVAYGGSASVATLLVLTVQHAGAGVVLAAVPIIGLLLATMHLFFRQQEAAEAMRKGRLEAVEREQQQALRHMIELQHSERRFHSAFTHASIGMALVAGNGQLLQVNRAFRALFGLGEEDASTLSFADFVYADDSGSLERQIAQLRSGAVESFGTELRCRHRNGDDVWVAVHCGFFSDPRAEAPCLILQVQDITARRLAEVRLEHIAFHDSLTGLPNRRRFHDLLARSLARVRADPRQQFGVMFLDFDRFKLINDCLGHHVGDEFLVQLSRRIQDHVRPGDIVARLGGDEFAVLVQGVGSDRYAIALAERLLKTLSEPLRIAGTEINTSVSIGITSSAFDYSDPVEVLRDADIAMYRAKAAGKARYALFDIGLRTEVSHRLLLERELRRALDSGQLRVEYQPLYSLGSGMLTGFEALARWQHPELGTIGPKSFIPIAEESGLIVQVSDFVLRDACRQLRRWQERHPAFAELTIQINVSGNDLAHSAFVSRIGQAISEARLQPRHLTLELTENILMARLASALPMLEELRALGVRLSVDDFGTGYSSLAHLSSLPIDSLKIDKSFVRDLANGSKASAVVHAIVFLARALGKSVLAEGIETAVQLEQLRESGCHAGQGFHLSPSLPADAVDALLDGIAASGRASALPAATPRRRAQDRELNAA
jgi:diguanylate cyclase (GGDEF)-like protein/PAS domain S-box-containing protein